MIIDTRAAIMLLMKKWADTHSLTMKEKASKFILSTIGMMVQIMSTTSESLLLVPILEVDVAIVAMCLGYF